MTDATPRAQMNTLQHWLWSIGMLCGALTFIFQNDWPHRLLAVLFAFGAGGLVAIVMDEDAK